MDIKEIKRRNMEQFIVDMERCNFFGKTRLFPYQKSALEYMFAGTIDPAQPNSEITTMAIKGKDTHALFIDDMDPKFKTKQKHIEWLTDFCGEKDRTIMMLRTELNKEKLLISDQTREIVNLKEQVKNLRTTCYVLTCKVERQAGTIEENERLREIAGGEESIEVKRKNLFPPPRHVVNPNQDLYQAMQSTHSQIKNWWE